MLAGDLCLSVIPANTGDSGLFARKAYYEGAFQTWRLPLLLMTGIVGMVLCSFAVRAFYEQILPQYRKTRAAVKIGGIIYLTSAGILHFAIGSLADWTNTLSPILGQDKALRLVQAQYGRIMPAMSVAYIGMLMLIIVNVFAVLTQKTVLPRRMLIFHLLVWQLVFVLIPDIRQLLGAQISTLDFVLSQGSGNAALFIWMTANAVWAGKKIKTVGAVK